MIVIARSDGEYIDMGRIRSDCKSCGKSGIHFAVRLYMRERDRYSVAAYSKCTLVKLACQECAIETAAPKAIEKWALTRVESAAADLLETLSAS